MLLTVVGKTELGGIRSFDKWPGYEQQCGSERPKTNLKSGWENTKLLSERYKQMSGSLWRRELGVLETVGSFR